MATRVIQQYLDRYAEPWVRDGLVPLPDVYQYVVVIPVHDEPLDCLTQVLPADLQDTLVIVVVNCAVDHGHPVQDRTRAFLNQFVTTNARLTPVAYAATSTVLIVDCCRGSHCLPAKQGVGLARKIGADLALAYIAQGVVACPWIHCTDADVILPRGYFEPTPPDPNVAVALYPFAHQPSHGEILLYEISLRYYVTQLAAAGSPYAFHTIGSLLKINAHHYAAVRGFPKRQAAEDFYMLNKLAKTGQVLQLRQPVITLASRISRRVPFGTGAALYKLSQGETLPFYDPRIFDRLGEWLQHIDFLWSDRTLIQAQGFSPWWQAQGGDLRSHTILLQLGLAKTLTQAWRQCSDLPHFRFFLWSWFDAFRTLKFIHDWRDGGEGCDRTYPSLPLTDLAPQLGWLKPQHPAAAQISDQTEQHLPAINTHLITLEKQQPDRIGPTLSLSAHKQ